MMTQSTSDTLRSTGLILGRMIRSDESRWQNARSWLGGLPRINPAEWPRTRDGSLPYYHLAHLDLRDIPNGPWSDALPRTGALSIFHTADDEAETVDCAAVYTRDPDSLNIAAAPTDYRTPCTNWMAAREIICGAMNEDQARRAIQRWPVEFHVTTFTTIPYGDEVLNPSLEEILGPADNYAHLFPCPQHLSKEEAFGPVDPAIFPWDVARRLVQEARLQILEHERRRKSFFARSDVDKAKWEKQWLEESVAMEPLHDFIDRWQAAFENHDPFAPLGGAVAEKLEAEAADIARATRHLFKYGSGTAFLRDVASETYREMMTGPRDVYESIPQKIREYIEIKRRRFGYGVFRHQMFGIGSQLLPDIEDRSDLIMLFEAGSDDMMFWCWGDLGVLQFWITPENLAAHNWSQVECTFAC